MYEILKVFTRKSLEHIQNFLYFFLHFALFSKVRILETSFSVTLQYYIFSTFYYMSFQMYYIHANARDAALKIYHK